MFCNIGSSWYYLQFYNVGSGCDHGGTAGFSTADDRVISQQHHQACRCCCMCHCPLTRWDNRSSVAYWNSVISAYVGAGTQCSGTRKMAHCLEPCGCVEYTGLCIAVEPQTGVPTTGIIIIGSFEIQQLVWPPLVLWDALTVSRRAGPPTMALALQHTPTSLILFSVNSEDVEAASNNCCPTAAREKCKQQGCPGKVNMGGQRILLSPLFLSSV